MKEYVAYTDEELLDLVKSNNMEAFNNIYDRYWKPLLVRADSMLQSKQEAEEVVHDVFVKLWQKKNAITLKHSFKTYLVAMLHYSCFRILAQRKRKRHTEYLDTLPDLQDCNTQEYLDHGYLLKELDTALNSLPEKCKLIFKLSRETGLSDKEIATTLNLSVNTVRTQMYRALSKLKTRMGSFFTFLLTFF